MTFIQRKDVPLVVVDTDPGTDDAMAIYMLLAAENRKMLNLLAITCVCGNTSVDNGTKNALRVLQSVDRLDVKYF
jgi:purine nucleosidase